MTISKELEATILRYYHVEKWCVGTIRRQLGIHSSTVQRVLLQEGIPAQKILLRPSRIDPFLPFIMETLKKYPTLSGIRLYNMVCERGYRGHSRHFRHVLSMHRPRPTPEAYLRLKTLPGEQSQADWGHFGYLQCGNAKRPVSAFVMVLSFSRKIFLRFYLNQRMSSFLEGHEAAFEAWGGVPRVILYDNLRSAVLERQGDTIRFNETLLKFSAHYHFEARPVAVARGNQKGRVERGIRYIRENFFEGREWKDIDDLNAQARDWYEGPASDRICPEDHKRTVQIIFEEEKAMLLPLPNNSYPTEEREEVRVGKTPYVRFDKNDYSIPHAHVCKTLTVIAESHKIRILDGAKIIAEHSRSYDQGRQIEIPEHIQALVDFKRKARQHSGQNRLTIASPSSSKLLKQAITKGYSIRSIVKQLLLLLDGYGATELEAAISEALLKGVPHPNAVRLNLERRRENRDQPPLINLDLPDDKRIRDQVVTPHSLKTYDQLQSLMEEQSDDK